MSLSSAQPAFAALFGQAEFKSLRALLGAPELAPGPGLREIAWGPEEARVFIENFAACFAEQRESGTALPVFAGLLALGKSPDCGAEGGEAYGHAALLAVALERCARAEGDGAPLLAFEHPLLRRLARRTIQAAGEPPGEPAASALETGYRQRLAEIESWLAGEEPGGEDGEAEGLSPRAAAEFLRFVLERAVFLLVRPTDDAALEAWRQGLARADKKLGAHFVRAALLAEQNGAAAADAALEAFDAVVAGLKGVRGDQDLRSLRAVLAARYAQAHAPEAGADPGAQTRDGALHRLPLPSPPPAALRRSLPRVLFNGDLVIFLRWAERFAMARRRYRPGLEPLFFLERCGIDLEDELPVAAIDAEAERHGDSARSMTRVRVVLSFLDQLAARLIWNGERLDSGLRRRLAELAPLVGRADPRDLALELAARLAAVSPGFGANAAAPLGQVRGAQLHGLLARLAAFARFHYEGQDFYPDYEVRIGRGAFEPVDLAALIAGNLRAAAGPAPLARMALAPKGFIALYGRETAAARGLLLNRLDPLAQTLSARKAPVAAAIQARLGVSLPPLRRGALAEEEARNRALAALAAKIWDPLRLIAIAENRV